MPTPTVPPAAAVASTDGDWFTGRALTGNSLRLLPSGAWTDQARQELIRGAKRNLYISAYAWEDDATGTGYFTLLTERAAAGVDVRLLLDSWGCKAIKKYQQALRAAGVRVLFFNPGITWSVTLWLDALHEKLVLADGQAAILGGSGWSDVYRNSGRDSANWYDLDALIRGPAAAYFQNQFVNTWRLSAQADRGAQTDNLLSATGSAEDDSDGSVAALANAADAAEERYGVGTLVPAPSGPALGPSRVLPLYTNPLFNHQCPILETYIQAIAAVPDKGTIKLYSPYCVPNARLAEALLGARGRGVRVQILTNSKESNDNPPFLTVAMYQVCKPLLAAGVEIYLWPRRSTMHRKGGVFGGRYAFLGSDNLDVRSLEKQTESVAFTDDPAIVAVIEQMLDADLALAGAPLCDDFITRDLESISAEVKSTARLLVAQL